MQSRFKNSTNNWSKFLSRVSADVVYTEKESLKKLDESYYSADYHDDLQAVKPISGSHFDLSFKPTPKVTYKTILPQVSNFIYRNVSNVLKYYIFHRA